MIDSISKYIKEEDDILFKRAEKKGRLEGKLEGRLEDEQKGKLEEKTETICKFLKDNVLTTQQLASYFDVTEEFVESLRNSLDK